MALIAALSLFASTAWAFDLADLQRQLGATPVVRGAFTQERTIPALRTPLVTRGTLTLWDKHGLLWKQTDPAAPELRISATGVASRTDGGWSSGSSPRSAAWLSALLGGDMQVLSSTFAITLTGDAKAWRLDLAPKSRVMAQMITGIRVEGGASVEHVTIEDVNGQSTRLIFSGLVGAAEPTASERSALAP